VEAQARSRIGRTQEGPDDAGSHAGSAKTGVSANTATPAPIVGGKPGDAGVPIDTRITVHQGHERIRANKDSLFKKRQATIIPGIALKHERVNNLHQASPVSDGSPLRNAIGTVVERDKTVAHAAGTAGGAIMSSTQVVPQHVVATFRDHNAGTASDKASTNPSATGRGNHISAAADALKM
jgi:hypothetical protein